MMIRTRFAPSPTGHLHLGHGAHILYAFGISRALGAEMHLRMEDHDTLRCRPEYAASIQEDLHWLGLIREGAKWSFQSRQKARYDLFLQKLIHPGLVYACSCSRKDIQERTGLTTADSGGEIPYDGHCRERKLPIEDVRLTLRLRWDAWREVAHDLRLGRLEQIADGPTGDFPLRDNKGLFTYQFCVVVDDLLEKINLVVRGEDLLSSTGKQIHLLHLLGGATPLYYHHPLVLDAQGEKLSKRYRSLSLRELRHRGFSPEDVLGMAAKAAGLLHEERPIHIGEIAAFFTTLIGHPFLTALT